VYHLLNHIAFDVVQAMRDGKTLEEIDECVLEGLRKKDRIAVYERVVHFWGGEEEGVAVVAHLRTLKRRKRPPQPTHPPTTILQ
jgi:hypothetical protein